MHLASFKEDISKEGILDESPRDSAILSSDLRTYFNGLLSDAAENQRLDISPHAFQYVTDLLVAFHETARLFAQKGVRVPVLADMLVQAMEADFHRRVSILRQLGDTSLMVSGFFPEALSRRSTDLNYYQKMGEVAYSHLSSLSEEMNVFDELSMQFQRLASLINEVSENTHQREYSLLKLLEFYTNTGSDRVLERLKRQGVIPLHQKKDPFIL